MGNLTSKTFWDAALARAIRTVCQTVIGCIGGSSLVGDVDWRLALSASLLAGLVSVLTSVVTNLPEVENTDGVH